MEMNFYQETYAEMMMIGKNLRRIRERKRITQTDLARRAELSNVSISRIERGETPNIFNLMKIMKVLHVKFEDLTRL